MSMNPEINQAMPSKGALCANTMQLLCTQAQPNYEGSVSTPTPPSLIRTLNTPRALI